MRDKDEQARDETSKEIVKDESGLPKNEIIKLNVETSSVTISHEALKEITNFSINAMPKEAIGLLSGREIRPKELYITKGLFVTRGEEYSVSFSESDFQVFDRVTSPEFCVGWWHSHPGFGCFLSHIDIATQNGIFYQPYHVALVVDPLRNEIAFFTLDKKSKRGYKEINFATIL